jgi:putrescine transport system ATP-binding protein
MQADPAAAAPAPGDGLAARPGRPGAEPYVRMLGIRKEYDGFVAVDDVSLDIGKGEIFALLGASGCGKSTLLRVLAGFERPTQGTVLVDGEDLTPLPPYERPVNMMFQSYALFPHMTVEQNIAFGLKQDKHSRQEVNRRVEEMLAIVQMQKFARRKPHQLSGGQQQRVALARSLAKSPKLLLLDEPMGALDSKLRAQMQLELANIIERLGVTCVMVTHDQEEAMTMAHRIAVMDAGRILQVGTPDEIYEQPGNRFVAGFIGSVNLFEGTIAGGAHDFVEIGSPALQFPIHVRHGLAGFPGQPVSVSLRPESISVSSDEPAQAYNKARGAIEDIAYFGSHSVYHVRLPSGLKVMANYVNGRRGAAGRFHGNDEVWLCWGDDAGVVLTA